MDPVTEPHPRGRYGTKRSPDRKRFTRTTPAETLRILRLHAEHLSQSEIARVTGITQQRVCDIIHKHASTTDHALSVLQANSYQAAVDWVASFKKAVKRGEHRPMRDALIATGVIAPDPENQGITVIVGSGEVTIGQVSPSLRLPSQHPPAIVLPPGPALNRIE